MKRILCFLVLFLLSLPVFADESSNWGVQPPPATVQNTKENSEKVWDREENQNIYENYGSGDSPEFLNRGGIDPRDSMMEDTYDYEDDTPYDSNPGSH